MCIRDSGVVGSCPADRYGAHKPDGCPLSAEYRPFLPLLQLGPKARKGLQMIICGRPNGVIMTTATPQNQARKQDEPKWISKVCGNHAPGWARGGSPTTSGQCKDTEKNPDCIGTFGRERPSYSWFAWVFRRYYGQWKDQGMILPGDEPVSYTHLRAHETLRYLV